MILRPGLRLTVGLSVPTIYLTTQVLLPRRPVYRCQGPWLQDQIFNSNQQRPLIHSAQDDRAFFNPTNFRQISTGSFSGVVAGYMVGKLSRMLALVTLVVILAVQFVERRGLHIIPYQRLRGVIDEVDAKRMITSNWAFKYSFGATFLLSAYFAN